MHPGLSSKLLVMGHQNVEESAVSPSNRTTTRKASSKSPLKDEKMNHQSTYQKEEGDSFGEHQRSNDVLPATNSQPVSIFNKTFSGVSPKNVGFTD